MTSTHQGSIFNVPIENDVSSDHNDGLMSTPSKPEPAQNGIETGHEGNERADLSAVTTSQPVDRDSGTTLPSTKPIPDPSEKIAPKASKSTLTGTKRNGSISNSHGEHKLQMSSLEATGQPTASGSSPVRPEKRKTRTSRFLAILNCCGGTRDTNDIDMDEGSVPVRRMSKLQTDRPTQTKTQDTSGAESSTADESKELSSEKIGGPPYSELKSAGEPRMQEAFATSSASPSNDTRPSLEGRSVSQTAVTQTQHTEPASTEAATLTPAPPFSKSKSEAVPPDDDIGVSHDETTRGENADKEIDMPDAPAQDTVALDTSQSTRDTKADSSPPLPPPPSVAPLRHDVTSDGTNNNLPDVPKERQKWLLPPIRPEFKGKKCLVLDLDETLVHSSFKVGSSLSLSNSG